MKKKFLLTLTLMAMLMCMLIISVGAASTTGNIDYDETAILKDGTELPIYDEDKNPLLWYISGTETVTNEIGETVTKNIYSSVVSTATKENPDKNGYYVKYNGTNPTFTGPTGEKIQYHYSQSIYVKHVTDTSVNFLGRDTMVVANFRGVDIGDFQGGTINKLQYFYAPACMVRCGDFRQSTDLKLTDFTQSVSMRNINSQAYKTKTVEIRFPVIEPVYDENGVIMNPFVIDTFAFQGTPATVLNFPDTLYKVDKNAFQNAKQLTSIGSAKNLTIVCDDAFENCFVLTGIDFKNTTLKSIGARAFRYAGLQAEIEFPSTLTSIGDNAFYQAKLIKSVKLSENLETLGAQVFRQITTLEYFDFNGFTLETLGDYFFWKNSSLRAVSLPEGLKSFGSRPFEECSKLEVLYLPDSLTTLSYFQKLSKLYFVNEPFTIDWYEGVFDSEDWGGQKPAKPEVYYMPLSLTTVADDLHSCKNINNTVVFPKGVTQITEQYTFFAIADKNFVFLGNVTLLNVNSTAKSNYYFINDSVTAETLDVQGNGNHNVYFHSAGVHISEKNEKISDADCVNNEKIAAICFCGYNIEVIDIEGTALGHNHTIYVGMAYENYFEAGYRGYKCDRCEDVNKDEKIDALFTWKGYSYSEVAMGGTFSVTQAFFVNKKAIAEYESEGFSFGVLATGNANGGAKTPSLDDEKVLSIKFNSIVHDYIEIKVNGITDGYFDANIIFCAYVVDKGEMFYLDNNETKVELTGVSYNNLAGINA